MKILSAITSILLPLVSAATATTATTATGGLSCNNQTPSILQVPSHEGMLVSQQDSQVILFESNHNMTVVDHGDGVLMSLTLLKGNYKLNGLPLKEQQTVFLQPKEMYKSEMDAGTRYALSLWCSDEFQMDISTNEQSDLKLYQLERDLERGTVKVRDCSRPHNNPSMCMQ